MDTLPEIPSQRPSLTGKQATRGTPATRAMGCYEDSGLQVDLRESLASTSKQSTMRPLSPGGQRSPTPPNYLRPSTVSPRMQNTMRRSMESVRISRNELNHKEQLINTLRSDNLELQRKFRELEHSKETSFQLQETCSKLAQQLNCSVEGVASESVGDILKGKINTLTQEHRLATAQVDTCRGELERVRGDLAATDVRASNLQSQLTRSKSDLGSREAEIGQLKSEMENLQQTCARTGATMQSLRQQLVEAEGSRTSHTLNDQLTQLQTEMGRVKNELSVKSDQIEGQRTQLSARQSELDSAQERASTAESMYADLFAQLLMVLQLESDDSIDNDYLISQVSSLAEECLELRLRMETVTSSMKTVELDSKANRETILRLVTEAKKHEGQAAQIGDLEKSIEEMKGQVVAGEREKEGMEERLLAAKKTLLAQENEFQAKESKIESLSQRIVNLQRNSDSEKSLADSAEQKYLMLCESLQDTLGAQSNDSTLLLSSVQQMIKNSVNHGDELTQTTTELARLQERVDKLQTELAQCREALKDESTRVKQLAGKKVSEDILTEGVTRELEKHKAFIRRLTKAVNLDSGTAEILSGDFAHDAILTKAEQLTKHETQSLAEKQTAVYTLQRKLKSCRQSLDSKELHLGLVQKKVTVMEERLLSYTQKEKEWGASIDKGRKMEKKMERLHTIATQQKETIMKLKEENADVQKLKTHNGNLEDRVAQLLATLEEVSQARVHQAQQLAEARQKQTNSKTKTIVESSQDKANIERLGGELETSQQQLDEAKHRERELVSFKAAVKRLLKDNTELQDSEALDDYGVIAKLERLLAMQQRTKETTKCLEASLRQLESGFKSSYNDALTLLATESA
ncbi:coiled-coil domain-containing protein 170-like isoform X2 [Halichondria panicea]|uniref:coiled-coil domain-containing protein 170-like isoform X2 n=1 Tax=Halichondria panicea TaxID=6063 RepID=UPI00312BACD6